MPDDSIYCQAATFSCNCCVYKTAIYSDKEWLEIIEERICERCKRAYNKHFEAGTIYRHDLGDVDEEIPLHPQCARLPAGLQHCEKCINRSQIHWTELVVHCHQCEKDTMFFTEYTESKNIALLMDWCLDWAKPSHPMMEWEDKNGHLIFVLSGWGDRFSAT